MKLFVTVCFIAFIVSSQNTVLDDIAKLRTDLYANYWQNDQTFEKFQKWDQLKGLF